MSLPLTRRIARAALLVAASAAPAVGAAGAASAADLAPSQTPKLGGLSALDPASLGELTNTTSQQFGSATGEVGGKAGRTLKETLPGRSAPVKSTPAKPAKSTPVEATRGKVMGKGRAAHARGVVGRVTKATAPSVPRADALPLRPLTIKDVPTVLG